MSVLTHVYLYLYFIFISFIDCISHIETLCTVHYSHIDLSKCGAYLPLLLMDERFRVSDKRAQLIVNFFSSRIECTHHSLDILPQPFTLYCADIQTVCAPVRLAAVVRVVCTSCRPVPCVVVPATTSSSHHRHGHRAASMIGQKKQRIVLCCTPIFLSARVRSVLSSGAALERNFDRVPLHFVCGRRKRLRAFCAHA